MAWRIHFAADDGEEKSFDVDDLPIEFFKELAREEGVRFWDIGDDPGENPDRFYKIVQAAAEQLGIDPPDRPETMRAIRVMAEMFSRVPDVEEQPMMDGFPQVPGETEVGSTSTSPGDTDGPQT